MDKNSMIDARTERTNGFWMHGLECSFIGGCMQSLPGVNGSEVLKK